MYLIEGNAEVQAEVIEVPVLTREALVVKEVPAAKEAPAVKEALVEKEVLVEVDGALVEDGEARVRGEAIAGLGEARVGDAVQVEIVEVNQEVGVDHETENEAVHRNDEEDQRIGSVVAHEIEDPNREIGDRNHAIERVNHASVKDARRKVVVEIEKVLYPESDLCRHR